MLGTWIQEIMLKESIIITLIFIVLVFLPAEPVVQMTCNGKKQPKNKFNTKVIVGVTLEEVPRIDPMTGEKSSNTLQIEHSAIFYSIEEANYILGLDIYISGLVEDENVVETGQTLPVFNVDILIVKNTNTVKGKVVRSFRNYSFEIGEKNYLPVERSMDPRKKIAVKIYVNSGSSKISTLEQKGINYYFTVPAKKEGDNPVAVALLSAPLYKYEWRHDLFYDPKINFIRGNLPEGYNNKEVIS